MYYTQAYRLGDIYANLSKEKQNEHKTNSSSKKQRRADKYY